MRWSLQNEVSLRFSSFALSLSLSLPQPLQFSLSVSHPAIQPQFSSIKSRHPLNSNRFSCLDFGLDHLQQEPGNSTVRDSSRKLIEAGTITGANENSLRLVETSNESPLKGNRNRTKESMLCTQELESNRSRGDLALELHDSTRIIHSPRQSIAKLALSSDEGIKLLLESDGNQNGTVRPNLNSKGNNEGTNGINPTVPHLKGKFILREASSGSNLGKL